MGSFKEGGGWGGGGGLNAEGRRGAKEERVAAG